MLPGLSRMVDDSGGCAAMHIWAHILILRVPHWIAVVCAGDTAATDGHVCVHLQHAQGPGLLATCP
jgi:hypothetical protein